MAVPWGLIISGAQLGIGLMSSNSASDAADMERRLRGQAAEREYNLLAEKKKELESLYEQRQGYITDEYGNRVKSLKAGVRDSLYDMQQQFSSAAGRTGFAHSGTVENAYGISRGRTKRDYGLNMGSLYTNLQSTLLESNMAQFREVGQIETRMAQLEPYVTERKKWLWGGSGLRDRGSDRDWWFEEGGPYYDPDNPGRTRPPTTRP